MKTKEQSAQEEIEKIARKLCEFDNARWDDLYETTRTFNDTLLSQKTYLRRAREILETSSKGV